MHSACKPESSTAITNTYYYKFKNNAIYSQTEFIYNTLQVFQNVILHQTLIRCPLLCLL